MRFPRKAWEPEKGYPFIREKFYADYPLTELYKANETINWLIEHEQTLSELSKD